MVIASPSVVTERPPLAEFTMLYWIGISRENGIGIDFSLKPRFYEAVVGQEVVSAECLRLEVSSGCDNVHAVRHHALNPCHKFRIEAELQDRAAPGLSRKFRIHDLIRPRPQVAGPVHLQ